MAYAHLNGLVALHKGMGLDPAAAEIRVAHTDDGDLAAVDTDIHTHRLLHCGGESNVLLPFVDETHSLLPEYNSRVSGKSLDGLVKFVPNPDNAGIIRSISGKPTGIAVVGGARLAGNGHSLDLGGRAGAALNGVGEQLVHIVGSGIFEHLLGSGGIVQNHIVFNIFHSQIGSGFGIDTVAGEGCKSGCHLISGHTVGQTAHGQRGDIHVGQLFTVVGPASFLQRSQAKPLGEELEGNFRRDHHKRTHRNGIQGSCHAGLDGGQSLIRAAVVPRPDNGFLFPFHLEMHRIVVDDGGRINQPHFNGRGIHRNRFEGGSGLEGGVHRMVPDTVAFLLTHIACHSHHVSGGIVHDGDSGLDLLAAVRTLVEVAAVGIDGIHCRLDLGVKVGINGKAAAVYHSSDHALVKAGLLHQIRNHFRDDRIHIPGVHIGIIFLAVIVIVPIVKVQLGTDGSFVLRLGDIAVFLLGHLAQNDFLTVLIVVLGGPDHTFSVRLFCGTLQVFTYHGLVVRSPVSALGTLIPRHTQGRRGTVHGGVVGNAGQRRTFRQIQFGHRLAKVMVGCRLHAVALIAQVDHVEIQLKNLFLAVILLQLQRSEYLQNFSFYRNVVVSRYVLDQLLGNGRTTVCVLHLEEHIEQCAAGTPPVNALVGPEGLILNGNYGVNEILRDLLVIHPLGVLIAHKGFQLHV